MGLNLDFYGQRGLPDGFARPPANRLKRQHNNVGADITLYKLRPPRHG